MNSPLRYRFVSCALALLGMAILGYLLGAAVLLFELPSAGYLQKAFLGARQWHDRRPASTRTISRVSPPPPWLSPLDRPEMTFDGFTLYARVPDSEALLIDMQREVVHRWAIPFSQVWPNPPHLTQPVDDAMTAFFGCYLYANGDLLVLFHGDGSGLVKLDKDSNVLWSYPAKIHHDVDVGEDGAIYAILAERLDELPSGMEPIPVPCEVDSLVLLSPDGKLLKKLSILEALRASPYALLLSSIKPQNANRSGDCADVLHTNFVQVLTHDLAAKFPMFKAGQVLVSMRELDAIAVLDMAGGAAVWAARGPWKAQHSPQFLDNGHLLIFDNRGLGDRSRVLEYDPRTQAFPWSFSGEHGATFFTNERGMSQRLPNGNTLIVYSDGGIFFEVNQAKQVVWSCLEGRHVTMARRFAPAELNFLPPNVRARP